ncbi:MAG: DUF2059 domain-containing protein [Bryobacteraceae bacterium]
MKPLATLLSLTIALLCCASPILADDAAKAAKIEQMLALTHYDRVMKQTLEQMKSMQLEQFKKLETPEARAQSEQLQQKTMALLADRLSYEKVKPLFIKLYMDVFTEEEIDGMVGFYKSPAGKAMLEKTPQLMQRLMPMMQKLMSDLQPDLQKILEDAKQKPN